MENRMLARLLMLAPILFLIGCTKPISHQGGIIHDLILSPSVMEQEEFYWWSLRFRIAWPRGKPPNWSVGLLLADIVVEPALVRFHNKVQFWRFHRRAARDDTGHQFSFIFYSDSSVAGEIIETIKRNEVLDQLLARKLIEEVNTDDMDVPARRNIEAMSDPYWSIELQKAWPAFIMGVSATWLELINQNVGKEEIGDSDLDGLLKRYDEANESVGSIWIHEGQHAFFHHLNAIFGYEPVIIRNRINF